VVGPESSHESDGDRVRQGRAPEVVDDVLSDRRLLPSRVYRFRMLGMALSAIFMARVLYENQSGWGSWAMLVFTALVWPHVALWRTRRSAKSYETERQNLLFDSFQAGIWASLLHFNLLPSALLLTLAVVDKLNTGIRNLWLWSLPAMLLGILLAGASTGFAIHLESSTAVVLACMPMLVIHTMAVSLNGYWLVRRVQRQNRRLDELSRIDVLTGLSGRRHWQAEADSVLAQAQRRDEPACLLLVDVDEFKGINDCYGHTLGDDVLCRVADILREVVGQRGHVGRIGGDEFGVVLWADESLAMQLGQRICEGVAGVRFEDSDELRCTVSCGVARQSRSIGSLRDWMIAADVALYRAKNGGRGRACSSDVSMRA